MIYRIEFTDAEGVGMTKEIRDAENDNEAIKRYEEFKEQLKINPSFKVMGLVMVEVREVLTRILPRQPA